MVYTLLDLLLLPNQPSHGGCKEKLFCDTQCEKQGHKKKAEEEEEEEEKPLTAADMDAAFAKKAKKEAKKQVKKIKSEWKGKVVVVSWKRPFA